MKTTYEKAKILKIRNLNHIIQNSVNFLFLGNLYLVKKELNLLTIILYQIIIKRWYNYSKLNGLIRILIR